MAEAERNNSEPSGIDIDISESAPGNAPSETTNGETNICRIFRVQDLITDDDNVRFFKPKILSIGPYYHGSSNLRVVESMKLTCRRSIFGSNSENSYGRHRIMKLANRAKNFYRENITMGEENFASMLLLDGCFILFTLRGIKDRAVENVPSATATSLEIAVGREEASVEEAKSEAMSIDGETTVGSYAMKGKSVIVVGTTRAESSQGTTSSDTLEPEEGGRRQGDLGQLEALNRHHIVHDLLLVENQIPFFVLEEIHKLAAGEGETTEPLKEKIATYVKGVLHYYPKAIDIPEICSKDFYHLLHLCHMFFRPSSNPMEHHSVQAVTNDAMWHRAMKYHNAGVEFRVKDSSTTPHSLLDVTFSNGIMEIPHLSIDGKTESIFRNLIMFELGCPHVGKDVNAYVIFMTQFLNNIHDVELLVHRGIIEILGPTDEVLSIFGRLNGLAILPCWDDYYLKSTLQSVEAHYRCRPNWWFAWWKHKHCENPCLALAALGGIIVILCTVIQALFAVLQFFIQPK